MTAAEQPRTPRQPRGTGNSAVDTVTLTMSFDEADAFTVYLAEAFDVYKTHCEQNHVDRLRALQIRALRNKIVQIRSSLPEEDYGKLDL